MRKAFRECCWRLRRRSIHPESGKTVLSLKRPLPVTSCTVCASAGYNFSLTDLRCAKSIGGERCTGTNSSARNVADWLECVACQGIGVYRNAPCARCGGVGLSHEKPTETSTVNSYICISPASHRWILMHSISNSHYSSLPDATVA